MSARSQIHHSKPIHKISSKLHTLTKVSSLICSHMNRISENKELTLLTIDFKDVLWKSESKLTCIRYNEKILLMYFIIRDNNLIYIKKYWIFKLWCSFTKLDIYNAKPNAYNYTFFLAHNKVPQASWKTLDVDIGAILSSFEYEYTPYKLDVKFEYIQL